MSNHHFFTEEFSTPTGTMLLLTDAEEHARALDWEDHAARVQQLLRQQYGTVRLEAKAGVSRIRRAIEAYFAGVLAAIADLPAVTAGTAFQREVWAALRGIPLGRPRPMAAWRASLAGRRRCGRWGWPTAPTRSASSCRAIG